jgi:UPF0042 nucleotide-binding protein
MVSTNDASRDGASASASAATSPACLVVLTGLSGAGKTVALRALEDLDFYCVDNLPVALIPSLWESVQAGRAGYPRVALGVDARNRPEDLAGLPRILSQLTQQGIDVELVFLDTRDEMLIKRYSDTRRRHPLAAENRTLADAIVYERQLLRPLLGIADRIIDTSDMNVHQLRRQISVEVGRHRLQPILLLESFAYKRGVPADADFVFDMRCLPNPHWVPTLRPLSGRDAEVRAWLESETAVTEYLDQVKQMMAMLLPKFDADGRAYLTIAFGCTGGRHRSVYMVERLAEHFRTQREGVLVFHRELS